MQKAWKMAVLGAMMVSPLLGGPVFADETPTADTTITEEQPPSFAKPQAEFIKYTFYQNDKHPAYAEVFKIMKPLYKGSQYDLPPEYPQANPLIGIGEFDLNGDKIPEVIAYPVEDDVEAGMFCAADSVCPHYVLDVSGGEPVLLGKIEASSLDRGEEIKNGYWELKAYTHDWTTPRTSEFNLYVFDTKDKLYKKAETPPVLTK